MKTKRIMQNENKYFGVVWIPMNSSNEDCSIGFWQQVTKYYSSIKNLKRFNQAFNYDVI